MTRDKWAKLSPEEQRIKVHTTRGHRDEFMDYYNSIQGDTITLREYSGAVKLWKAFLAKVPDYLNDLNAMHEAEKLLEGTQIRRYIAYLSTDPDKYWELGGNYSQLNIALATASQRAEAFVLTMEAE